MATDPYFNNVILLLSCDGPSGSTVFVDKSPLKYPIISRGVVVSTAEKKYGTGSAYFAYLQSTHLFVPGDGNFDFSISTDFTIELWYKHTANGGTYGAFIASPQMTYGSYAMMLYYGVSNIILTSSDSSNILTYPHGSSTAWRHVAVTRAGNVYRLFFDGVKVHERTLSAFPVKFVYNYGDGFCIGRNTWDAGSAGSFQGWMDNIRITRGIARYTSDFTAPDDFFDTVYGSIGGKVYERTGAAWVPGIYPVRLYNQATGELVATTNSTIDGTYMFDSVPANTLGADVEYYIVAVDESAPLQRLAVAERVIPT